VRRVVSAAAAAVIGAGLAVGAVLLLDGGSAPVTPPPIHPPPGGAASTTSTVPAGLLWAESRTASPLNQDDVRWTSSDRIDLPPLVDPCGDGAAAGNGDGPLAVRQIALVGPGLWKAERLVLYADRPAATRAFRALTAALARCARHDEGEGTATIWTTGPAVAGEEALFVTGQRYRDDRGTPGSHRGVLMRQGRAVVMFVDFGQRTEPTRFADLSLHLDHARQVAARVAVRLPA
jgi:hypothetical protein